MNFTPCADCTDLHRDELCEDCCCNYADAMLLEQERRREQG